MAKRLLFVPITKVDVEKREVWGRAVEEITDKAGEVFDYATSRPLFDAWSEGFAKATDGLSLGNVRAMHGSVAAGKLIAYQPDDAAKAIDIGTKVVDDAEWAKVLEGVYTGFSIGGSYEKRWKDPVDPTRTRYTASPAEISLVDNPCVPSAMFSVIKADGTTEARPFQLAPTLDGAVRKGLWSVSRLADLLASLQYLAQDTAWEAESEGDASPVPPRLRTWLGDGVAILTAMVAEEGAEAVESVPEAAPAEPAEPDSTLALAAPVADLAKTDVPPAGPAAAEADVSPTAPPADDARLVALLTKALHATRADDLAQAVDAAVTKATADLRAANTALQQRVDALAAEPLPPKGVLRAPVTKAQDLGDPAALLASALARPLVLPPGMQVRATTAA